MGLLDDARRLDNTPLPTDDEGRCCFCDEVPAVEGHHGCPWLAMPRIVAALEAAEQFVEFAVPKEPRWKAMTDYDRKLGALVTALRGEDAS